MQSHSYSRSEVLPPSQHVKRAPIPGAPPNLVFGPGGQPSIINAPVAAVSTPQIVQQTSTQPDQAQSLLTDLAAPMTTVNTQDTESSIAALSPTSASPSSAVAVASLSASTPTQPPAPSLTATSSDVMLSSAASPTNVPSATLGGSTALASTPKASAPKSGVPPFVILLGVLAALGIITALITWWFRLRRHIRRRRSFVAVRIPWANRHNDGGTLMEEGGATFGDGTMLRHEDGSAVDTWQPLGDRDVGEPKRSNSNYPFAGWGSSGVLRDSVAFPLPPTPSRTPKHPPPLTRRGSTSGSAPKDHSASSLGPLKVANLMPGDVASSYDGSRPGTDMTRWSSKLPSVFGTPREVVPGERPRFWGLDGQGLQVPWAAPRSDCDRTTPAGPGQNWDHLPPLPMPGGTQRAFGWTDSFKTNLTTAFNAVSRSISGGANMSVDQYDSSRLTHMPPRHHRRSTRRGSIRGEEPWTRLEETGEGARIVHVLSRDDIHHLAAPLNAMVHARQLSGFFGRRNDGANGNGNGVMTRASSVYSTASTTSDPFSDRRHFESRLPLPSSGSFSRQGSPESWKRSRKGDNRIPRRSDRITRVSSSGCLAHSEVLSGSQTIIARIS